MCERKYGCEIGNRRNRPEDDLANTLYRYQPVIQLNLSRLHAHRFERSLRELHYGGVAGVNGFPNAGRPLLPAFKIRRVHLVRKINTYPAITVIVV